MLECRVDLDAFDKVLNFFRVAASQEFLNTWIT